MAEKTLVFDLGQVVINYDLNKFIKSFSAKTPLDKVQNLKKIMLEYSVLAANYEKGLITSKEFYRSLSERTHYTGNYNEFSVIWNEIFDKPTQEIVSLIKKLKNKHKIALLSNTNELHFDYLLSKYPEIFDLFDDLVLSYKIYMRKPESDIYQYLIKVCNKNPDEIFFTDDIEINIAAAKENGIKAYVFKNTDKLITDLESEGVVL